MTKAPTRLSDVEVQTVGLVESGAIGEDFLLLKSKGGNNVSENTETLLAGILEKLKGVFVSKEEVQKVIQDADAWKQIDELQKAREEIQKVQEAKLEELTKANETLTAKVIEAEQKATLEREAREKREFLEKAASFMALPVRYDELGNKLHELHKAVPTEAYDFVFNLLKAVDAQLGAAGIFNEMGTSAAAEQLETVDKVSKAVTEGKSPKDALLSLSKAEQEQLLDSAPYAKGGKK